MVPVADTLDQDLQALKQWLESAWRYLAEPSITSYERRELRNYMKEADTALRTGLQKRRQRKGAERAMMPLTGGCSFRIFAF